MEKFDAIIIGSGAGGSILAKELARKGKNVLILEKGSSINEAEAFKAYDFVFAGVDIWRIIAVGGTTLVSFGNTVPVLVDEIKSLGLDLRDEINDLIKELKAKPLPEKFRGKGTRRFIEIAKELKYDVYLMPKSIDPEKCIVHCKHCTAGCITGAKWSALKELNTALSLGAKLVDEVGKVKIITSGGKVKGIKYIKNGVEKEAYSPVVVSCAGALGTPEILFSAGLEEGVGENLFVDIFVTVGGIVENIELNREIDMQAYVKLENGILTPFYSVFLRQRYICKGISVRPKDIMGIMVKIADTLSGTVSKEGKISKPLTARDIAILEEYSEKAAEILEIMGANPKSIIITHPRGVHPGGTAAIGNVVDKNLETKIEGLYVADASVLPKAPGAPPILTIMATAKHLAKNLNF